MFEAAVDAFVVLMEPGRLLYLVAGVALGVVVGIIPGLGGVVGMSVMLPFLFGMDAHTGIAFLMGFAAVVHTADTFPSVLIGVPGSAGSQATILDGYPMTQRGDGARALGAGFMASMIGGVLGAAFLFVAILFSRAAVLALGSPQLFMLTVLGLSMVAALSRGSAFPGLIGGAFGLLLGSIGGAPAAPVYRFTFDQLYLYDGISIAVVSLALFAVPEVFNLAVEDRAISRTLKLDGRLRDGIRDVWRSKLLVVRSSMIGGIVGVIPGLGGAVVDWLAYGIARQTSRNNHTFGHGDVRGVIAPEAANNTKEGGALVPSLLFGIPGSAPAAILLGALLMFGVQIGPDMVGQRLDITLTIIWTLAVANVLATGVCLLLARQIARLSLVPGTTLFPVVMVVIVMAAYQSSRSMADIIALLVLGALGWCMREAGWPRAPVLIGFVLAHSTERYLHISMSRYGFEWLTYPSIVGLGIVIILLTVMGQRLGRRTEGALQLPEGDPAAGAERGNEEDAS